MSEANSYYQSLLEQGYDVDQAKVYTREHFPNFAGPAGTTQPAAPTNQQSSIDPMVAMMMMNQQNQQNQQMMMQQQALLAQSQQNQNSSPVVINNMQQQSVVGGVMMASHKSTGTGYLLWLLCFLLICGAHRFYYNKPISGVIYLFTFGLFGFGQLYDLLVMPELARTAY